ncbi:hypothetical protein CC2G_013386 [Coprinopsis cinerea AmutBmut pab1-1]|nr:hypothetical protein CC2G_013386 [Coprinopsis cinerea AmutBmut pab1-1]
MTRVDQSRASYADSFAGTSPVAKPSIQHITGVPTRGGRCSAATQSSRFDNWSLIANLSRFGAVTNDDSILPGGIKVRSFFQGGGVHERMAKIRKAIVKIRREWEHGYWGFVDELEAAFLRNAPGFEEGGGLFGGGKRKEWGDRVGRGGREEEFEEDYGFLKLYTDKDGYNHIFSVLNNAFRTDELEETEERLRAAVFLVELLTIELFNYTLSRQINAPRSEESTDGGGDEGFTGVVYRGMNVTSSHFQSFLRLMEKPVEERYWAIPLAFMSCSASRDLALEFTAAAAEEPLQDAPTVVQHRVLFRIHVVALDAESLREYRERFPTSVVTTICAVDISAVSAFPEEKEVVLRGPFFQLLRASKEPIVIPPGGAEAAAASGPKEEIMVFDAVVFNTNRDHPSTMEMDEDEGAKAREFFASAIGLSRTRVCMELCREFGLKEDEEAYRLLNEQARDKLRALRNGSD